MEAGITDHVWDLAELLGEGNGWFVELHHGSSMPVFTVIAPKEPSLQFEEALKTHFPHDHMAVGTGVRLVAGEGIAKDISDKLGISDGALGHGVVLAVSGYFGWANNAIWEWLALKTSIAAKHA